MGLARDVRETIVTSAIVAARKSGGGVARRHTVYIPFPNLVKRSINQISYSNALTL